MVYGGKMSTYFNLLWILAGLFLVLLNTWFWIFLSFICDKITGVSSKNGGPPDHAIYCVFSCFLINFGIGVAVFAPFNNWYR